MKSGRGWVNFGIISLVGIVDSDKQAAITPRGERAAWLHHHILRAATIDRDDDAGVILYPLKNQGVGINVQSHICSFRHRGSCSPQPGEGLDDLERRSILAPRL